MVGGRALLTTAAIVVLAIAGAGTMGWLPSADGAVSTAADVGSWVDDATTLNESQTERLVWRQVNDLRAASGMNRLQWNERAARAAERHAEDMAERDYFSHTSLEGETQQQRYAFCRGGENAHFSSVAGNNEEEEAREIVNSWLSSPPHRERGVYGSGLQSAGVGIAVSDGGELYAVMGFCMI